VAEPVYLVAGGEVGAETGLGEGLAALAVLFGNKYVRSADTAADTMPFQSNEPVARDTATNADVAAMIALRAPATGAGSLLTRESSSLVMVDMVPFLAEQ
jgi:hypothetical protein